VALPSLVKRAIAERGDRMLGSLSLLERSRWVPQLMDLAIRGVRVESMPGILDGEQTAILVSNYPSVSQSVRAVIKVGCRLSTVRSSLCSATANSRAH